MRYSILIDSRCEKRTSGRCICASATFPQLGKYPQVTSDCYMCHSSKSNIKAMDLHRRINLQTQRDTEPKNCTTESHLSLLRITSATTINEGLGITRAVTRRLLIQEI